MHTNFSFGKGYVYVTDTMEQEIVPSQCKLSCRTRRRTANIVRTYMVWATLAS